LHTPRTSSFTSCIAALALPATILFILGCGGGTSNNTAPTQTSSSPATINWTDLHQEIDGFGAADAQQGKSMSSANEQFFFGTTGTGQLGLSLLRVGVTDGAGDPGSCASVGASCAGVYGNDMQAIVADGGRVYASPWSPPAIYKTNGVIACASNAGLAAADYGPYATWLANFALSVKSTYSVNLYAISIQNEPNVCQSYDSAIWTAAEIDTFVGTDLGPAFASKGVSTLIFVPEGGGYSSTSLGNTCGGDSACSQYVGGINWHDYDAKLSGTNTVTADPYPSAWAAGKKFWETEASCAAGGVGPAFCETGFNTDITDALDWAAVVDQRLAVDGANAWLYWWLIDSNSSDDQGLMASNGTVPKRAYMLGQYSRFVRPGYYRIDATHLPVSGVSVSAYNNTATNTLVIVATNYTSSSVSQTFTITNAPAFSTITPWTTSSSLSLAQQSSVPVSSNSFTYTLPPNSITTFVTP
jgi:glucuronoarabinoxylan endo-1,4-beta-xylanase